MMAPKTPEQIANTLCEHAAGDRRDVVAEPVLDVLERPRRTAATGASRSTTLSTPPASMALDELGAPASIRLFTCSTITGMIAKMSPTKTARMPSEHGQDGERTLEPVALQERDRRVDAEREEQRRSDVGEDRRERRDAAADEHGDENTEAPEEAEPERVLDLHRVLPLR